MYSKSLFAALLFLASLFLVLSCSPTESPFVKGNATVNPILYNSLKQDSVKSISDTVGDTVKVGFTTYLPDYIDSVTVSIGNGAKIDTSHTFVKNSVWPDTVWIKLAFRSSGLRTVTLFAFIGGTTITKSAEITILPRPITISAVTASASVVQGDSIALTATVSGVGPYTYKWFKDTSVVTGASLSSYAILNFQPVNAGSYTCLITDQWGDTARTTPPTVLAITMLHAVPKWAHDTIHIAVSEGSVDSINLADSCMVSNGGSIVAYTLKNGSTIADSLHGSVWKYAPIFTDSGSYTIRIQASTATDSATLTMVLHVVNVDRPPQFDAGKPLTSYAVKGGAMLSFAINATDPDGDSVSCFIKSSTLPRTAPVLAAKTVTWQSATTDSTNAAIVIGASDGLDTTFITIQVAVGKVNAAPSLGAQYLAQTVGKGQTIRIYEGDSAKLTFSVTDPDSGQTHVLRIADRSPLSCGTVVFDSVNYKFMFVPSFSCATKDSVLLSNIAFVVTDNGTPPLSDTLKVNFDVINVDRAPVLMVVHDTTVFQSKPLNFMAQAIDPDNDPVTITASGLATASLPDSAKFNPKTGLFSWTPAFNQTGTFSIVFSASDGNLTAKDTTTIIVKKTDRAPVFNAIPATLTGAEGSVLKQYVKATDPDGDAVTLATVGAPFTKGATIVSDTLSWTPGYSDSGTYQVSFIASDGILYDTVTITVKIANTNRPPVATAQSVNAGRNTAKTIILSATDPDGDPIAQFKITKVASNGTATLSDQVAGTVVYTPNQGFIGVDTFSFSASDGTLWSLTSANVTVTVDSNKVAPQITTEPRIDTTINQGGTFTITVATNNAFPSPAYLWYQGIKGSGTLKGTTSNPVYSKVGVAAADSGNYYVIVSNTSGADTSSYSHITVDVPPSIVTGPVAPGAKCQGDSITLGVTASGTPPLSYQWQLAGNNITGAIAASYHIASISSANAGIYTCAVSNVCGASAAASTQGVTLTVNTASTAPNGATANPTTICSGSSSSLSVNGGSLGTGASWKWYTDAACSMPVTGTNTGTPISVSPTSNTTYYVRAEGGCGSTAAASATVTLNAASTAPTSATASPTNICSGGTSSLSVNGGTLGSGATWKWYTDAACSIPVTGNNTGTPITVSPTSNTTYYVRAEGTCGPTTAASVTVTLNIAPAITTQPVQDNLWPTQTSASFSVAGSGTGLTYQWLRRPHNGTPANISGANSATYTFAPVKATNDQDKYSCQITNTCGTITSNEVLLNYIQANSVAPGYGFTLFLCTDAGVANGVWAVGNNAFGQLGDGTTTSKSAPVRVMASSGVPLTGVTAIAAGGNFSMFLLSDGSVWTCGDNSSGQLGIGTTIASSSYPVKVTGISNAIHIAAGYKHSVFQTSDVAPIYTCGDNTYGQGGYGSQGMTYSPINVTVSTAYLAGGTQDNISAGDYHTVVYSSYDAKAYACGLNTSGQLGDGTTTNRTSFVQMPQMPGYASSIGTGANHTMEYGSNYTWMCGNNASGQLGNNSTVSAKTPVDISSSLSGYSWMVFAGGSNHSLFWDNATTLMACGDNSKGQLGIGSTTNSLVPTAISFTGSIAQVAARSNSSFILTTDGRVYGFGDNSNGQLGDKTTTNHTSPTWITW